MSVKNAIAWGFFGTFVIVLGLLTLGFLGGLSFALPGVAELKAREGVPEAELLWFNPLAPWVVIGLFSAVIWLVGRMLVRRRKRTTPSG